MILIDPKITHIPLDGEVWLGTQLHTTDAGVGEIEQAWLVRPRKKDGQPLPSFDVQAWRALNQAKTDSDEIPVGRGWVKPSSKSRG